VKNQPQSLPTPKQTVEPRK